MTINQTEQWDDPDHAEIGEPAIPERPRLRTLTYIAGAVTLTTMAYAGYRIHQLQQLIDEKSRPAYQRNERR